MLRLIFFLILAVALAWGVIWVSDHPGDVVLNWGGWHIQTSAGVLAGGAVLLAVVSALGYRLWVFITRAPGNITAAHRARRSQKGYKALTKGMVAVAAGDAEESRRQVQKADGLLGEPPLTLLLKAQSAQLNGDEKAAETFFEAMLEDEEMEFLGLRGLLNQAIKRGDDATALELAKRAQALKPKSAWLAEALFELEGRAGSWASAGEALGRMGKLCDLSQGETRHRQAVVALGQSLEAERDGNPSRTLKLAEKAVSLDTALIAAAVRLAELYLGRGHTRKARNVVEKAWAMMAHPDLAPLYFRACQATDALQKVTAAEKLLALRPDDPNAHLALADAALEAELWGQARTHIGAAMEAGSETRRTFTLMADLEARERGDQNQAHHWLMRAAGADPDPAWVCDACGHVEAEWAAHCPKCNTFDSLKWDTPQSINVLATAHPNTTLLSHRPRRDVAE